MADEVKRVEGCLSVEELATGRDIAREAKMGPFWIQLLDEHARFRASLMGIDRITHIAATTGSHWMRLDAMDRLRALLLSQGLHIVGEADWAVLEAMGKFKRQWIDEHMCDAIETKQGLNPRVAAFVKVFEAEVARRAAKGE